MKTFINWLKKPSISKKLIVSFIAILIIPILILEFSSYRSASGKLDQEIMGNAKNSVDTFNTTVTNDLGEKAKAVTFFSESLKRSAFKGKSNQEEIKAKFSQYVSINQGVARIYGGADNGTYVQAPKEKLPEGYDPRQRPWYQDAMKAGGEIVVTDPYVAASDGSMVITIAQELKDGSGVVAMDITIDKLLEQMKQIKVGKEGYAFIATKNKTYVAHKNHKAGEKLSGDWVAKMYANDSGELQYTLNNEDKKMTYTTNELTGWKIAGTMYMDEIKDASKSVLTTGMIVLSASIVAGGILILFIVRSITKPLKNVLFNHRKRSAGGI